MRTWFNVTLTYSRFYWQLEEKLKKDRQEAQRQKLIELQKKTPEVTITVVDPKKPPPRRFLPQCGLPEVSILPTSARMSVPVIKQLNDKKKDNKQEVCSDSNNSSGCISINRLNTKTKTSSANLNAKNKSINSTDKCEVRSTNSNQGSKNSAKSDKVDTNKSNKPLANAVNAVCAKNGASNNTDKSPDVDLLDKKLTKKERKKLKKEMKKLEEAKAKESGNSAQTESQPQIVTIKRVLESNSVEPTVTITLKGQTPAEDKVLFTLVNGQTKEPSSNKSEQEQNQSNGGGKKKKVKANNSNGLQQGNKQQSNNNSKQQTQQTAVKAGDGKNLKQQANNEKSKTSKQQADEKKAQQQTANETKNSKSKKDKKNTENKENMLQQQNTLNKNKNQQNTNNNNNNKKQNKTNTPPQTPVSQKQQQNHSVTNESATSKKAKKQQQQQQQQQDKSVQSNSNKSSKNNSNNNANKVTNKNDSQKNVSKTNQAAAKQRSPTEVQNTCNERVSSPLSSQFKDIGPNSKIDIENLKLPPGITITKVDAPAKPIPIRPAPMPKPVNPPKQTTIIAAPMSGVQSSYASSQAGGNVIVVDTGKLKQDLLPKTSEKGE